MGQGECMHKYGFFNLAIVLITSLKFNLATNQKYMK